MGHPHRKTEGKFDPEAWSQVYDDPNGAGRNFVFRRSVEITLELLKPLMNPGARWLDAGCGTGQAARSLHQMGAQVIGLDHDPRMLAFARQSCGVFALPVVAAGAEALPFRSASLDGLVATSLIGCLPLPASFLSEAKRVLRDDGHFVITFTNRESWLLRLNYLAAGAGGGGERYRLFSASEIVSEIESIGFRVEHVRFYNFVLHRGNRLFPSMRIARRADTFFGPAIGRRLGRNFVVVARKGRHP